MGVRPEAARHLGPGHLVALVVPGGVEDPGVGLVDLRDLLFDEAAEPVPKPRGDPASRYGAVDLLQFASGHLLNISSAPRLEVNIDEVEVAGGDRLHAAALGGCGRLRRSTSRSPAREVLFDAVLAALHDALSHCRSIRSGKGTNREPWQSAYRSTPST
jgi:hypothetical protein